MNVKEQLNGIQHIGIPTNNIEATVHFYEKMGLKSRFFEIGFSCD